MIGGQTRFFIAKLNNTNGNADLTWNPNANSTVNTIAISGSDIYVGGLFSGSNSIGGQTRNRIAKLNNTNGNADATWNPNANNTVNTIAISGSDIYVGGAFTTINGGTTRNRLAKLNNTDGTADATWNPNANERVLTIAISGGDIYVGGFFAFGNSIGGQSRNFIAKLNNTNGNADLTWNQVNANGQVNTIAISGGDIYVGGNFAGTALGNFIAKLNNTNGDVDATWNPQPNAQVFTIAVSGSDIYAGGLFSTMGGINQPSFALFTTREVPVELVSFTAHRKGSGVILNWQTATEVNNYGFNIERCSASLTTDNKNIEWVTIGFVNGHGNSNSPKSYSFTDTNPTLNHVQYRLKQIDSDGKYEYSKIVEVSIEAPAEFILHQNYPNPFNPNNKDRLSASVRFKGNSRTIQNNRGESSYNTQRRTSRLLHSRHKCQCTKLGKRCLVLQNKCCWWKQSGIHSS